MAINDQSRSLIGLEQSGASKQCLSQDEDEIRQTGSKLDDYWMKNDEEIELTIDGCKCFTQLTEIPRHTVGIVYC